MRSLNDEKFMLIKRLLVVLNFVVFMNCGFIKAQGCLTEEIIEYGTRIASNGDDIEFSSQPQEALREISDRIKIYFKGKSLPVEKLSKERDLGLLILAYGKEKEADLSNRLLTVFRIAAGMVKKSIVSGQSVEIDFFVKVRTNSLDEIRCTLSCMEFLISSPMEDPLWGDLAFCKTIPFVFFAILPDVPSQYALFKQPPDRSGPINIKGRVSPTESILSDESVGYSSSRSSRAPSSTSGTPPQPGFMERVWKAVGYVFTGEMPK